MAVMLASVLALASCLLVPGQNDPEPENMIYRADSELYVVVADSSLTSDQINSVFNGLANVKTKVPVLTDTFAEGKHNIVLGRNSSAVSTTAYAKLDQLIKEENYVGYVIYSDGVSVAIAYSSAEDNMMSDFAIDYFVANMLVSELVIAPGIVKSESLNVTEYFQAQDDALVEAGWVALAEASTPEIAEAMKHLYGIYDDTTVDWLANLYDPGIGGFYHANSAKNTFGYLPDAESTAKMLSFLETSGMVDNYATALPEWMKKQIGDFVYGLQDPNGYFYHPQWGTDISLAKRGRDLNWCTTILKKFGRSPRYDTITNVKGDGGDDADMMTSFITAPLGESRVLAVSKVLLTAESETLIPEHLQNEENFMAYLISLEITKKSYNRGNELSSQIAQIKAQNLDGVLIEYLSEIQFESGLWHEISNHYAVNGLMKICGVYNSCKQAMPRAEEAAMAAIDALIGGEIPETVISIYNPWVSIGRLTKNQTDYGGAEGKAVADRISAAILEVAPEALYATRTYLERFIIDDTVDNTKSFSYNLGRAASGIQGAPAAVAGTYEGDLGGTNNACAALVSNIYTALKLSSYFVPIYTNSDFRRFMNIIENLDPIVKVAGDITIDDPQTFDDLEAGGDFECQEINVRNVTGLYGDYNIVADTRRPGNVFEYHQFKAVNDGDSGAYVCFPADNAVATNLCSVWEADVCVDDVTSVPSNGIIARFEIGRNAYMIQLVMVKGKLQLWESSSGATAKAIRNDLGVEFEQGEWFNLRVEYYLGDHESVRIKVYVNDELIAISNNYYDGEGVKLNGVGTPDSKYKEVYLYVVKSTVARFLFDDVNCYNCNDLYSYDEPAYSWAINVDAPDRDSKTYTFDDNELPEEFVTNGTVGVSGGAMSIGASSDVKIPVNAVKAAGNALELELTLAAAAEGAVGKIAFIERNSTANPITEITLSVEDGVANLLDADGAVIPGAVFNADGGDTVKFILFEEKDAVLIYVNGSLKSITTAMSPGGATLVAAYAKITAAAALTVDDLKFQRIDANYDNAVAGGGEGKLYDFENGKDGVQTEGAIITVGGDKVLSLSGENAKFPVNATSAVSTATKVSAQLTFKGASSNGKLYRLALVDENGEYIYALVIKYESGEAVLCEQSELGTHSGELYSFTPDTEVKFELEYFADKGICNIFFNGLCAFASCIPWNAENAKLIPAYFVVERVSADGNLYLDDVKAENVIDAYSQYVVTCPNEDDKNAVIGFETTVPYSLPSRITTNLPSNAPYIGITEAERDGEVTKALQFGSGKGGMDTVSLATSYTKGNTTVLEMDICVNSSSAKSLFQLWLMSGSNSAYLITATAEGNNIIIKDTTATSSSVSNRLSSNEAKLAVKGEWAKLRIEYSVSGGTSLTRVLVDGEVVIETTGHFYGAHNAGATPYTDISGMDLKFYKDTTGEMLLDNLALYRE